jgi:four helix bundle protein
MIQSYRDLDVWKKSIVLTKAVYKLTETFPKQQQYGLTSQVQRSAVSIAANIAEGRSRQSTKEFLYHLNVAYGSLAETETHLTIACELGLISSAVVEGLLEETHAIGKMINGLVRALENRQFPDPRPQTPEPSLKEPA